MTADEATYRLLEVIGTWLSGIGSLFAVAVALYLARVRSAVKLKITAGHRLIITPGTKAYSEVINIRVVNLGERAVLITGIELVTGILKRKYFAQMTSSPMNNLRIPGTLEPGHQGSFYIELDLKDQSNWIRRIAKEMPPKFRSLWVRRMKVGISTAVGRTVWKRIEKGLQEKLLEAAQAIDRGAE
jgi:hypothetical protein